MEGEINNFIVVWLTVLASLIYCHIIAKFIPKGTTRLLALLPILCLFVFLPLNLTTVNLAGMTSFFITWLANFKLLLFAFGKGPLSPICNSPLSLSHFLSTTCLPIKILQNPSQKMGKRENPSQKMGKKENPSQEITKMGKKSPWNYAVKVLLFGGLLKVYGSSHYFHPKFRMALYCFHIYFVLDIGLAMFASMARALVRVELEPQFDEPYLATSLQDFWGKRWNLMVTSILHPTVYNPVRSISGRLISKRWAPLPAVFATFLVSGLMHELIFYYIGRLRPTGDVTVFFLIHGVCLGIEIAVKKALDGKKLRLPPVVSRPAVLGFVLLTSFWFFFPPFLRFGPDVRGCKEAIAFVEFVTHGRLISPNDISCPYF